MAGYTGFDCDISNNTKTEFNLSLNQWINFFALVINYCASSPCLNGGTCIQLESEFESLHKAAAGSYQCQCDLFYSGSRCELYSGTTRSPTVCPSSSCPCDSSPCLNGGSCSAKNNGSNYNCACPAGSYGTNCEIC